MNRLLPSVSICVALFLLGTPLISEAAYSVTAPEELSGTTGVAMPVTGLSVTGTGGETVPVKLFVTNGTLAFGSTTGLTFTGDEEGSSLEFQGSQSAVNAALATLTYTRASTGSDTLEVSLIEPGEVFFPENGHLYEYIASAGTWNAAYTKAENISRYGAEGYLATILSAEENSFVAARLGGDGWMGASDAGTEGDWKWVAGPESGTSFWSGAAGGSVAGGNYANWNPGEPNDSSGNEDCAQFYASTGRWNDLPCSGSSLPGYVAEFGQEGDMPEVASSNISITITNAPSVQAFSPADNATDVTIDTNLEIEFSAAVTAEGGAVVVYTADDDQIAESVVATSSAVTGGGTDTITVALSQLTEDTEYYVMIGDATFADTNDSFYAGTAASTTWSFTTGDFTPPVLSAVSAEVTASTTATLTWSTSEPASSKVMYGLVTDSERETAVTNTAPRVSSHTVALSSLVPCAMYSYRVVSEDAAGNSATSTSNTFAMSGCNVTSEATATSTASVSPAIGGSTSLSARNGTAFSIIAPAQYTDASSTVAIQIKRVPSASALSLLQTPGAALMSAGEDVFEVTAIQSSVVGLDSFIAPVSITKAYTESDIAGIDETTLWLYRYSEGTWNALDDCRVDTDANLITCTTMGFSTFALFGTASPPSSQTGVRYGCSDRNATNFQEFVRHDASRCSYTAATPTTPDKPSRTADTTAGASPLQTLIESNRALFEAAYATGITLPDHVKEYLSLESEIESGATAVSTTDAQEGVRDLTLDDEGDDVRRLQELLIQAAAGDSAAELARVGATGYFGAYTKNALGEYQREQSIEPHAGYFGGITRAYMKQKGVPNLWW